MYYISFLIFSRSPLKHFYTIAIWLCILCAIDVMIMLKMFCTVLGIVISLLVFGDLWGTIALLLPGVTHSLVAQKRSSSLGPSYFCGAYGINGKHRMQCILIMSRLVIINYDTILGATLVLSWRPWVEVFSLARSIDGPLGLLPAWKLWFSILMGAVLVVSDDTWLCGFLGFIGISNNSHAELLAIMHGLKLSWNKGHQNVIVTLIPCML